MNEQTLIESLATACGDTVPARADVVALQQLSLDDLKSRAERFLTQISAPDDCSHDRADWVVRDDHTAVSLPGGARAVVYHASGALHYVSGMAPLQSLFSRMPDKEALTRLVSAQASKLGIASWAGPQGSIQFERLFQQKAQGADRDGKVAEPVLARAIGAFRHFVGGIPVLGAASVALKLAGDGTLDTLSVMARPVTAEVLDKAVIIEPELAARQVTLQLASLLGQAKQPLPGDVIESQTMRFGYLDLGKRKAQRLLAPVFLAQVVLRHKTNRQAYVFAVQASEKPYLQIPQFGTEALVTRSRSAGECRADDR